MHVCVFSIDLPFEPWQNFRIIKNLKKFKKIIKKKNWGKIERKEFKKTEKKMGGKKKVWGGEKEKKNKT